jgi:hypothetical protein
LGNNWAVPSNGGFQMKKLILQGLLVASLLLTGCAGTKMSVQAPYQPTQGAALAYVVNPKVEVSDEALGILRQRLDSQLRASGLLASSAGASKQVEISIVNYYMRHGATRALVGVMAGADNMQSSVIVKDSTTQAVLGEFKVESSNPTAMGTSRGMIEDHADKIVAYLKSGGS